MGQPQLVLLGMMSTHPVAGVIWQTVHYLIGFKRLGFDVYYVEAGGHQPSWMLADSEESDRSLEAARFIDGVMRRFDLGDRWAFHALHHDGRCYGLSEEELRRLYGSAEIIINLHGGTIPLPEHSATDRLIFLETDPVALQIELVDNLDKTIEYLTPHRAFFTFGENYGSSECGLPVSDRFPFRPTRQPVVMDLWEAAEAGGAAFTTVGNWKQGWRDVMYRDQTYTWSKHHEFVKFLELPGRTRQEFELALSRFDEEDERLLQSHGWRVLDALSFSSDLDAYRAYIQGSRGEFTVAKDQNIRLRSGWFSDRSATYLASGRPVVTQDTGFGDNLPIGAGLFPFSTLEEAVDAIERINADYPCHCRAARAIAREHFNYDVVLGRLLADIGL